MTKLDIQLLVLKGVRLTLIGIFWFMVLIFCLVLASIKTPLLEDMGSCLFLLGMILVMAMLVAVRDWFTKRVIRSFEKKKQG